MTPPTSALERLGALAAKRETGVQQNIRHAARGRTVWTDEDTADERRIATVPGISLADLQALLALARRTEAAEKRVGELEAGLEPFAKAAGYFDQRYDDDGNATAKPYSDNTNAGFGGVQVKHYRAARALLTPIAEGR